MKSFLLVAFLVFTFCGVDAQRAGTLDSSFGENGKVIGGVGTSASALQLDGKVLAGSNYISRYLSDGSLDKNFGINGSTSSVTFNITGIGLSAEGRIVTGGEPPVDNAGVTVVAFTSKGNVDSSFGINGTASLDLKGQYGDMLGLNVLTNGSILAVGGIQEDPLSSRRGLVVRFLPDGTVDKNFGIDGKTEIDDQECFFVSAAEQADGKILVVGQTQIGKWQGVIARLNANGSRDSSFGGNGVIFTNELTDPGESFNAVALQKDGKIIASGTSSNNFGRNARMLAIRYNTEGSIDKSFGKNGLALIKFEKDASSFAMKLQKDEKIVLAGSEYNGSTFKSNGALARLTSDGIIDSSYAVNGIQSTDFGADDDTYTELLLQPDGKAIATGATNINEKFTLIMARYYGDQKQQSPIVKKIKRWICNHTLNWQYNDADVDYFVIEQSSNEVNGFKEVAKVKAVNRESLNVNDVYTYNLNDFANNQQRNANRKTYYRITAISNYSKVVSTVISDEDVISITISPNPVKDVMKISGLQANQKTTINIVNRNGNILQSAVCNSSVYMMNIAQLKSGLYNVQINVNGRLQSVKFVKE